MIGRRKRMWRASDKLLDFLGVIVDACELTGVTGFCGAGKLALYGTKNLKVEKNYQ